MKTLRLDSEAFNFNRAVSLGGKVFAEGGDEVGGERNGGLVFEQEREAFAELDDEVR